jgi:NAD(P)H-hydrate epimerase
VRAEPWSRDAFEDAARIADLAVDAVFGTGFSGEPRGVGAEACRALESVGCRVLAVDIPSGVSGADGSVPGVAVRAGVTVAIQALKPGHVLPPGTFRCGRVDVAEIGINTPSALLAVPTGGDVGDALPSLEADTHKYRVGMVVMLAGSAGMSGAAVLAARGAVRSGAGLVVLGVPRSSLDVLETSVAEAVKVPIPDLEGQLDAKSVDELGERIERAGAVACGPGIGRGPVGVGLVRRVLEVPRPLVLDADGLWALGEILREDAGALRSRPAPTVLTPHQGEFDHLLGGQAFPDRLTAVREAAARWDAVVHLKGRRALTAAPDGRVWVNPTGNPGMATGGTGDVLTGVVSALVARGLDAATATWAGAWLHGTAGDVAAAMFGPAPMSAGDVADALPRAFARLRWETPAAGTLRTVLADTRSFER